jgi:beta-mannosidase
VYIHGQNHIPLDYLKVYGAPEAYGHLFQLLCNQGVNLIRVWGGGAVEDPFFYDQCDRHGILLWHELFLHSNPYPDYDDAFCQEFAAECAEVLGRVRNHPALALVCGGNEQREGWDEWGWKQLHSRFYGEKLITQVIPPIAAKLCPELPFIDNSPHGGATCQSPVVGECHNWGNFYNATKDPLFVTETCWTTESYSRPATLEKWMGLRVEDYTGQAWSERWQALTALPFLNRMPYTNWFRHGSLAAYLHGLEVEQMRADYSALSLFRYQSPSNAGIVYWSFTKGGPLFQFGCVDYDGVPLMAYYAVKRIFAPVGVYPYRDVEDLCVMASNHSAGPVEVTVLARRLSAGGEVLDEARARVALAPGGLARPVRMPGLYGKVRERTREVFYAAACLGEDLVFEDLCYFCPFGEYEGVYSPFGLQAAQVGPDRWRLEIFAHGPVRSVEIECNHKVMLSDNYFPTLHGKAVDIVLLERTGQEPLYAEVGALGAETAQRVALEV